MKKGRLVTKGKQALRRSTLAGAALLMAVSMSLPIAGEQLASALGNQYFDADPSGECDAWNRYAGSPNCSNVAVRMMVGETRFVRKANVELRAYFNSPSGQVTIYHKNWCPGSGGDAVQSGDALAGNMPAGGANVTRYRVGTAGNYIERWGVYRKTSAASCNANVVINVGSAQTRPAPGLPGVYFVNILVNHRNLRAGYDGAQNLFYVRITSGGNNYYIAQRGHETIGDAATQGDRVTFQKLGSSPSHASYMVRFGSNCDTTPGKRYRLSFYDIDNNGGGGAQQGGKIGLRLYDRTANKWLWNRTSPAYGPGSNWQNWRNPKPTYAQSFFPPDTANADTYWDFEAQAGHKYRLEVINAYHNNTLQMSTPFDGVYWNKKCQNPEARLRADVSMRQNQSSYEVGDTVWANARVVNTTSNTGRIQDGIVRRVWFDNGNQSYGAGDQLLGQTTTIGNPYVPPSDLIYPEWGGYQVNSNYAYICTSLVSVRANNSANGGNPSVWTVVTDGNDILCRPIGKYPSLQVRGGDIRTGGSFNEVGGICTATPTNNSSFSVMGHNYGTAAKGSFGEYGIVSAGRILSFGAHNLSPNAAASPNLMFGNRYHPANTIDGLFYSATAGLSLGAAVKTHCIPDVFASSSYAAANPTSSGSGVTINLDTTTAGEVRYHHRFTGSNQTLHINNLGATTLNDNKRRIIRVSQASPSYTGNRIVIHRNATYSNTSYASASALPFFALVADGDIDIQTNNAVTRLDGLFATRGDLVTCNAVVAAGVRGSSNGTSVSSNTPCTNRLIANGAFMIGGRIYPYRTFGQTTAADNNPAETFNLRGDLMVSEYVRKSQTSQMRTTNQIELPPRF